MSYKPDWADEVAGDFRLTLNGASGCMLKDEAERFAVALRKAKADGMRQAALVALSSQSKTNGLASELNIDHGNNMAKKIALNCANLADSIERGEI